MADNDNLGDGPEEQPQGQHNENGRRIIADLSNAPGPPPETGGEAEEQPARRRSAVQRVIALLEPSADRKISLFMGDDGIAYADVVLWGAERTISVMSD